MPRDAHRAYHEHLLGRMADVLGIDLDPARLSRADLLRAVARCSDCPDPTGCEIALEPHQTGAFEMPQRCRNMKRLEYLRDGS